MTSKSAKHQPPEWWYRAGRKMKFEPLSSHHPISIVLKGDLAALTIMKAIDWFRTWHVIWVITHNEAEHSDGNVWMTSEQLELAFDTQGYAQVNGLFVRIGRYLNIPGPGTGKAGDPNISILVTDDVKNRLQNLIHVWRTAPSEESMSKA